MRILVLNQYYHPDTAATAQRLTELCQELAARHRVVVVCGRPSYNPVAESAPAGGDRTARVRVLRVPSTAFHRSRMAGRICNYLTYCTLALVAALVSRAPDLVVAMTDPPTIGTVAWIISVVRRAPLVLVVQDLHPDVGLALRQMSDGPIARLLDRLNRFVFERAHGIIAISESMRKRLLDKGARADRTIVISNWADVGAIAPGPKTNPFSLKHGLADKFVVMYSGNIGIAQNLDQLVHVAESLRAIEDLRVVILGDGIGRRRLTELAERLQLQNVLFLPYQPADTVQLSFASADVFVIPLRRGLDGLVVPSKVFPVMASGRPFIASIEAESEIAGIVREFRCGILVEPDDTDRLAEAIRWAYSSRSELKTMGQRGRDAVITKYRRDAATDQYESLFQSVVMSTAREHTV